MFDRKINKTPWPRINAVRNAEKSERFTLQHVDLTFSNGREMTYERIIGNQGGAVLVVPIKGDRIVLIREYAVGQERYCLSFVKGAIDSGEDMFVSANRELQEEIGFRSTSLTLLKSVCIAPGYTNFKTHIILARDLIESKMQGDEPEELEKVFHPISRWSDLLEDNDFFEARSQLSLFLAMQYLGHVCHASSN